MSVGLCVGLECQQTMGSVYVTSQMKVNNVSAAAVYYARNVLPRADNRFYLGDADVEEGV
jgi:nucleoside phosphorylase